jgi:hypothetical protein
MIEYQSGDHHVRTNSPHRHYCRLQQGSCDDSPCSSAVVKRPLRRPPQAPTRCEGNHCRFSWPFPLRKARAGVSARWQGEACAEVLQEAPGRLHCGQEEALQDGGSAPSRDEEASLGKLLMSSFFLFLLVCPKQKEVKEKKFINVECFAVLVCATTFESWESNRYFLEKGCLA